MHSAPLLTFIPPKHTHAFLTQSHSNMYSCTVRLVIWFNYNLVQQLNSKTSLIHPADLLPSFFMHTINNQLPLWVKRWMSNCKVLSKKTLNEILWIVNNGRCTEKDLQASCSRGSWIRAGWCFHMKNNLKTALVAFHGRQHWITSSGRFH